MTETRKLAAILVADVVGYGRLASADEERILARLRALRSDLIDPAIALHRGRVVKRTGDGALVEFRSVVDATRCAIEVQNGMVERNAGLPPERRIEFRIGIHLGDVVEESDGDLMGDGVNIAARLEGIAEPGAVCLSEDAYRQVKARLDLMVNDLGEQQLKNIAEPMRVYALRVGGTSQAHARPATSATPVAQARSDKASIAVLPFTNMSGDPEQEYFTDGISEDIITDLSKLSELHIIARNSSFVYKHAAVSIPEVANALDVRYVLEGSVRKAGNRVRVTAQLIDSTTGGHVWAERFDRDLNDIFAVQDELTKEIVSALKVNLTVNEKKRLDQKRQVDLEAYNLFLRARDQVWLHTRTGNIGARMLLERAVAIEPDYAAAYAHIATTHVNDYIMGWGEDLDASLEKGFEIARRAVSLDEEEPDGYFAAGIAFLWKKDLDKALEATARCLALKPSSTEGLRLMSHILIFSGRAEEAIKTIETNMRLDPVYPEITLHFLAEARFSLGDFEGAVEALKRRLERNSDSATSYALLASCYGHLGRIAEGRAAWEQTLRIDPNFSIERRRVILPFRNPAEFELRVEGLQRAGVPV
jgi:TolB-like protein/class 3 adenylate cyclase